MSDRNDRAAKTIRMREDIYHQAKVAAVVSRKSVGQWIEEAVAEKVSREAGSALLEDTAQADRPPSDESDDEESLANN